MNYRKAMKGVHSERRLKTLRLLKAGQKKQINLSKAREEIKKYQARAEVEKKSLGFRLGSFCGTVVHKVLNKIKSLF